MNNIKLYLYAAALLLSGCATTYTQYYWGDYESLIYQTYHSPNDVPPSVQIDKLNIDIEKAQTAGKPVPPGLYAHLGLMYAADGNKELAIAALTKEKELFPDSGKFIDGLIQRSSTYSQGIASE